MHEHVCRQFKFCPKCGAESFHNVRINQLVCERCSFNYFINPAIAVGAVIVDLDGRILLIRRAFEPSMGKLGIPGGFIDAYETAEDGVRREIKEEVNLDSTDCRYLTSHPNKYRTADGAYAVLDLFFLCHVPSFDGIKAGDDAADYVFLHPSEIRMEEIAFPSIRLALERYIGKLEVRS